jgi:cytochrome c-type biogenesis protein CcmF
MAGALADLVERAGFGRQPLSVATARLRGLPRSAFGTAIAHFGLGVMLLGVVFEGTFGSERIVSLKPAQTVAIAGYELTFDGLVSRTGPNYREIAGRFTVRSGGATIGTMEPSKRSFAARGSGTTEAALLTRGFSQLYLSLGDSGSDGSVALRLYHKPLVLLIWFGPAIMALGGFLSLTDRRLRVGAPKPARRAAMQGAE